VETSLQAAGEPTDADQRGIKPSCLGRLIALQVEIELFWIAVLAGQTVVENLQRLPADRAAGFVEAHAVVNEQAHRLAVKRIVGLELAEVDGLPIGSA
jgi:hypothetical protein